MTVASILLILGWVLCGALTYSAVRGMIYAQNVMRAGRALLVQAQADALAARRMRDSAREVMKYATYRLNEAKELS